jgi:hypothetical protein
MDKSILALVNEKMRTMNNLKTVESSKDGDGVYNSSYFEIREISKEENLYVKISYYEDSYGEDDHIIGIEFVEPTPIQKVEYKSI